MGLRDGIAALLLTVLALAVAVPLLGPYRSEGWVRQDGEEVRVPRLDRVGPDAAVWDYLQQGRELARGNGFRSRLTYPVFLPASLPAMGTEVQNDFPVLWRQPGFPLLVAAALLLGGEEPDALLVLQGLALVLLALGTFFLARYLVSTWWAGLAALWVLASPLVLGVGEPLAATTLYAALGAWLWLGALSAWGAGRTLLWGVGLGLLILFRLETWLIAPALLLVLARTNRENPLAAVTMALVAAGLVLVPWGMRNFLVTGHPLGAAGGLLAHLIGTGYAGEAARSVTAAGSDLSAFMLVDVGRTLAGTLRHLGAYARDLVWLPVPGAVVAAAVGLWRLRAEDEPARDLLWGLAAAVAVLIPVLALATHSAELVAVLAPPLAVGGVLGLRTLGRPGLLVAGVLGLAGLGMLTTRLDARAPDAGADLAARDLQILQMTPMVEAEAAGAVVWTDAPGVYAWIWDRPALVLPVATEAEIEGTLRYLPRSLALISCAEPGWGGTRKDLVRGYRLAGGRVTGGNCPVRIHWLGPKHGPEPAETP